MSRTISPLRRIAAVAAIAGVTGFGAVAMAPAALADETTSPATVAAAAPAAPSYIVAPLPAGPIPVTLGMGHATVTLPPHAAQVVNTIQANLYASQGYQILFAEDGRLLIGPKICDPTKSDAWNKGCVTPDAPRF